MIAKCAIDDRIEIHERLEVAAVVAFAVWPGPSQSVDEMRTMIKRHLEPSRRNEGSRIRLTMINVNDGKRLLNERSISVHWSF